MPAGSPIAFFGRMTLNGNRPKGEIVVIEDDDDFRNLLSNHLRRAGYRVRSLRDGHAAVDFIATAQLRDQPPVAVVSDVKMPGYDGLSLLAAIRQARWSTPVILMTGFGLADPDAAERHDAVAVLAKPFPMSELDALLDLSVGVPYGLEGQA